MAQGQAGQINWGELRSACAQAHRDGAALRSMGRLLAEQSPQRADALSYVYDHLEHALGLDFPRLSQPLSELEMDWHSAFFQQLGACAQHDPDDEDADEDEDLDEDAPPRSKRAFAGVDALVWLLLQRPDRKAHLALTTHTLAGRSQGSVEISTLVRWLCEGEPHLARRISTKHRCQPTLWRQFLAAWAWCVIKEPTSSPILTLRKLPEDVWICKAWPSTYSHNLTSSGWEIHCDESPGANITKMLCEIWPGLTADLLSFEALDPSAPATPSDDTQG